MTDPKVPMPAETPIEAGKFITPWVMANLKRKGISTYEQLASCSESDLLKLPYVGRKTLNGIKAALEEVGLNCTQQRSSY